MKTFRYEIKDADGSTGVIVLNEFEATKLCASMTKDLYGTDAALQKVVAGQDAQAGTIDQQEDYYDYARDLPKEQIFFGTWTNKTFKKDTNGMMFVSQNGKWDLDPTYWHQEDQNGRYKRV